MATPRSIKINFIGGPFDGHSQPFAISTLSKWLALPVAENTLRLLQGKRLGRKTPFTTVARYELLEATSGWEYRFIETIPAKGVDLERLLNAARNVGEARKRGKKRKGS